MESKDERRKREKAKRKDGKSIVSGPLTIGLHDKLIKRETSTQLRLLPMHLSLEGLLLLLCQRPSTAWKSYHNTIVGSKGEAFTSSLRGSWLPFLQEALHYFEIHENQVGVLVFVSDALASTFVVSHPDDYRQLHRSILHDFFCKIFWHYAWHHNELPVFSVNMNEEAVTNLADIEREYSRVKQEWRDFHAHMATALLQQPLFSQEVQKNKLFSLQRFMVHPNPSIVDFHEAIAQMNISAEHHIGESIIHNDGRIAYLKTYRLSRKQCNRLRFMSQLVQHDWNPEKLCAAQNISISTLKARFKSNGLGHLIRHDW